MSGIGSEYVPSVPATSANTGLNVRDYDENFVRTKNSDGTRNAAASGAQLSDPKGVAALAKELIAVQAKESFKSRTVCNVTPYNTEATGATLWGIGAYAVACVQTAFFKVVCFLYDLGGTEFTAQKNQINEFNNDSDKLAKKAIETFGHLKENSHTTANKAANNRTELAQQAETLVGTAFAFASALDFSSVDEVTAFLESFVETEAEKIVHPDRVALTTIRADLKASLFEAIVEKLPGFVMDMQAKELTFTNSNELEIAKDKMIGYASLNGVPVTDSARNFVTDFKNDPRILGAGVAKATELAGDINALRQFDTSVFEERSLFALSANNSNLTSAFEYIQANEGTIDEKRARLEILEPALDDTLASLNNITGFNGLQSADRVTNMARLANSDELVTIGADENGVEIQITCRNLIAEFNPLKEAIDRFNGAVAHLEGADYAAGLAANARTNAEEATAKENELAEIIAFFSTTDDRTLETTTPESLSSIKDGLTAPRSGDDTEIQNEVRKFLNKKLELAEAAECETLVEIISQKLGNRRAGSARQTLSGPSIRSLTSPSTGSSSTRTVESPPFERSQSPNGYDSDDSLDLMENSSRTPR